MPFGRTVMSHTGPSVIFWMNSGERISAWLLQRGSMYSPGGTPSAPMAARALFSSGTAGKSFLCQNGPM
jgi:hypothetical protein